MKLTLIYEQIILENLLNSFKEKNVGDGKSISTELFSHIQNIVDNKINYVLWLAKNIIDKKILENELSDFKTYLNTFEKNKSKYPHKDINQYKTKEEIEKFKKISSEIKNELSDVESKTESGKNYVSSKDIIKLKEVGIKFRGMVEGFQVFEIPSTTQGNEDSYKRYNEILGKCKGREEGQNINICTFQSETFFDDYFAKYPGSSYFLFYNLNDPWSPIQVHYESGQFKNVDDKEIRTLKFSKREFNMLNFLYKIYPYGFLNIYQKCLGTDLSENNFNAMGNLEGKLRITNGNPNYFNIIDVTFVNGEKQGESVTTFFENKNKLLRTEKCTYVDGIKNGDAQVYYNFDYEERLYEVTEKFSYHDDVKEGPWEKRGKDGNLISRGKYYSGEKLGIIERFYDNGVLKELCDLDVDKSTITKYDIDGKIKVVLEYDEYPDDNIEPVKVKYYNQDGQVTGIYFNYTLFIYDTNGEKLFNMLSGDITFGYKGEVVNIITRKGYNTMDILFDKIRKISVYNGEVRTYDDNTNRIGTFYSEDYKQVDNFYDYLNTLKSDIISFQETVSDNHYKNILRNFELIKDYIDMFNNAKNTEETEEIE